MNAENNFTLWTKKYGNETSGHISAHTSQILQSQNSPHRITSSSNPIILKKSSYIKTGKYPKHLNFGRNKLFASYIEGCGIDMFEFVDNKLIKITSNKLPASCIHSIIYRNLIYVSVSTLCSKKSKKDLLAVLNADNLEKLELVSTRGKWSKFIKIHPTQPLLFVSNWFSNDLSVFDIHNPEKPVFLRKIKCGISPRGIDFTPDGKIGLVACYYSRNIVEIKVSGESNVKVTYIGKPYDYPNYSGNMRDIKIINNKSAIVSNMGRNLIHLYSIKKRKIVKSTIVGKHPNSITIYKNSHVLVSCFLSNRLYLLNVPGLKILGVSRATGKNTVGLATFGETVFSSAFGSGLIEVWKPAKQINKTNPRIGGRRTPAPTKT